MGTRLLIIEFSGGGPPEYKPGQSVRSSVQVMQLPTPPATVPVLYDPPGGALVLTVCFSDGSQGTPTVVRDGVGLYHGDYWIPLSMQYGPGFERWLCANAAIDNNALSERRYIVKQLDFVALGSPPAPSPPSAMVLVEGPATVAALPNTIYVCDVTDGSIVINLPAIAQYSAVGVIAAAGGGAYATNSITVNATSPQTLAQPAPNNLSAPVASYVIGGPSASSGDGALDAGTSIVWVNGGIPDVLSIQ